ncbi:MAG: ribosomal protein S18-alanine N-acetyltransferase [Candidatus Acidiferrum sp.]
MGVESTGKPGIADVRKFRPEDAEAIRSISEHSPEAANWSKESYVKFSQQIGSLALVAETDGKLSGFLIGRLTGDQAEILNLAVPANQRRRGNGHALLAAAHAEFSLGGAKSVYLEVRQSNTSAIAFYERHGFSISGLRKGYYRDPHEPALTLVKKLTA